MHVHPVLMTTSQYPPWLTTVYVLRSTCTSVSSDHFHLQKVTNTISSYAMLAFLQLRLSTKNSAPSFPGQTADHPPYQSMNLLSNMHPHLHRDPQSPAYASLQHHHDETNLMNPTPPPQTPPIPNPKHP